VDAQPAPAGACRLLCSTSATHSSLILLRSTPQVVKGEEPDVLDAISSGRCLAGVSSNAHMSYFLSTNTSWCDLKLVGQVGGAVAGGAGRAGSRPAQEASTKGALVAAWGGRRLFGRQPRHHACLLTPAAPPCLPADWTCLPHPMPTVTPRPPSQALNFGYYSIAFSKSRAIAPVVQGLNVLLNDAIEKNELQPFQAANFPPSEKRALCGANLDSAEDKSLSLNIRQARVGARRAGAGAGGSAARARWAA
jgi:hypothetical protein